MHPSLRLGHEIGMTVTLLDQIKDPIRMFAIACWAGACMMTLILIFLAWSAVRDANAAQQHLEMRHMDQVEAIIASRTSKAR